MSLAPHRKHPLGVPVVGIRGAILWALAGVALFAGWQTLTVQRNFGGNWTALFCTGSVLPIPPDLSSGTWIFPGSTGYDGQMYRYVAHDPWLRGIDHFYLDSFALRQRRILLPAGAWLLALGQPRWIDPAYFAALWILVFAGCYWTGRWLILHGHAPAWSLFYLIVPSTLVAADRCTIDVATSSLTVALLLYSRRSDFPKLYLVAIALCLSRETGFIPLLAALLWLTLEKRWRAAAILSTAAIPALAWFLFVWLHQPVTAARLLPAWMAKGSRFGIFFRLIHPLAYPLSHPVERAAQTLDFLALLGMILAFGLAAYFWFRCRTALSELTAALFLLFIPLVSQAHFWDMVYGYARPFSPLLICIALSAAAARRHVKLALLPLLLMLPRLLMQLGPQFAGIFGFHVL